jgi:hypothetical protein
VLVITGQEIQQKERGKWKRLGKDEEGKLVGKNECRKERKKER